MVTVDGINESTVVSLNMDYSNKKIKFKINAAVQKETPQVILILKKIFSKLSFVSLHPT